MNGFIQQSLTSQYQFLLEELENVEDVFLKKHHIPEKWSIHEHLAHLGRYHEVFFARLNLILNNEVPILERYVANNDDGFLPWSKLSTVAIITKTLKKRSEIFLLLKQLGDWQLKRIGIHPKLGKMTIEDWVSFFILHESHHLYAIFSIKRRFGGAKS